MSLGMVYVRPFGQVGNVPTVNFGVLATSTNVAVSRPGVGTQSVRIVNAGSQTIYLNFGKDNTAAAAVGTGMPMLGGTVETFLLPNDILYIAAIAATTGNTIYITTGESA